MRAGLGEDAEERLRGRAHGPGLREARDVVDVVGLGRGHDGVVDRVVEDQQVRRRGRVDDPPGLRRRPAPRARHGPDHDLDGARSVGRVEVRREPLRERAGRARRAARFEVAVRAESHGSAEDEHAHGRHVSGAARERALVRGGARHDGRPARRVAAVADAAAPELRPRRPAVRAVRADLGRVDGGELRRQRVLARRRDGLRRRDAIERGAGVRIVGAGASLYGAVGHVGRVRRVVRSSRARLRCRAARRLFLSLLWFRCCEGDDEEGELHGMLPIAG